MDKTVFISLLVFSVGILYGAINFIRGRGYIPVLEHGISAVLWGIVTGCAALILLYHPLHASLIATIAMVGMFCWLTGLVRGWGGWGLYFASWTWTWNPKDSEVPWIDWTGFKLVPFKTAAPHWTNGLRGVFCMSIRGCYIVPYFTALQSPLLGLAVGIAMGPVYGAMRWLAPSGAGTKFAEPTYAFLVGLAVASRLIAGVSL